MSATSLAVAGGLGAAALSAVGTALQYRAARDLRKGRHADGWAAVRTTLTSTRWLVGAGVLAAGFGVHAFALHQGPLTLVQPLLITGVLFALPASRRAGGPPIRLVDMAWAVVLVAALTGFLLTATPASQPTKAVDATPAAAVVGLLVVGIAACLVAARGRRSNARAALLGIAAGIALAGSAALLKATTDVLTHGVAAVLTSWPIYALVPAGVSALALSQLAYRAGPMTASLPAINSANPLVSVAIGTVVFDERFRVGMAAVSIEAVTLAAVLVATTVLTRRESTPLPPLPVPAGAGRNPAG